MSTSRSMAAARNLALAVAVVLLALGSIAVTAQEGEYGLGDFPLDPETYQKHLKPRPEEQLLATLPAKYDARDYGLVTSPKNQGGCGSCWAFASVGAMESHMLKQFGYGPTNLSEQQQVSCNTLMSGCDGGNSYALRYWETKGPLYESCFPYTASDATPCLEKLCTQLDFRVTDWHTVRQTPEEFKYSLYTDGPSYWRFDVYSDFGTFWAYGRPGDVYVNTGTVYYAGHAVLLIGWDDDKGAYLCKNSWGTGGPNNDGTFWIAYSGHVNDLRFGMTNFSLETEGTFPEAPTNLAATPVLPWQINLSWTDNSNDEDGFRIERSLNGINWSTLGTVGTNTTTYPDTTPTPGTLYYYRVIAFNSYGDSDSGNIASATLPIQEGPLVYIGYVIDDDNWFGTSGDDDGVAECGETVGLTVMLRNDGNTAVQGIDSTLTFLDITYLYGFGNLASAYPDIAGGASEGNVDAFEFSVDEVTPFARWIDMELAIDADNWSGGPIEFSLPIYCAMMADYHFYMPLIFKE